MADVFDDETEHVVSINEYIEGLEAEELEADMVLGGDDGKECTYSKGYMKRQAIFSCLTCTPNGNAGVCTACALTCHDGHEMWHRIHVVELWTKRKFRCDCGNARFGEFFCKLYANKAPENVDNSYNHNFKGLYCTCNFPYPDPDAEEQVEMIQCCICEDWFHEKHLGLEPPEEIPRDDEGEPLYEDFICKECASTFSFLTLYPSTIWATSRKSDALLTSKGEENALEIGQSASVPSANFNDSDCSTKDANADAVTICAGSDSVLSEKDPQLDENSEKNVCSKEHATASVIPNNSCVFGVDLCGASLVAEKKPMFLSTKWRDLLCRCSACTEFYAQKGISFLTDKDDSIGEYEKVATLKREEKLQQREGAEINFLNKLEHVQKLEILNGIADMKNEIQSFMDCQGILHESFDPSKAVTSADIHQIFENLAKKRQRRQ
ncbi:hypothetical protein ACLOJK_009954 [Asimina triloba]